MKKQINQLRAGVLLSYVNLALGSLIPMFYTPVMLRILGQAEHGLYSLANSTVSYLSLLSFGFGSTIIRYIAKYRAQNDVEGVRRIYGFFLKLYGSLAVLVVIGGAVLTCFAPRFFGQSLTAEELQTVRTLIPILSVQTALTFPISVFISLIIAHERYLYRRIMDIIATLLTPTFNLIALYLGYASVGMAVAGMSAQILLFLPNLVYSIRVLKITPSFERINKQLIWELVGFSCYVFLGNIADMLFWATDKVILGMLIGSTAVSIYQIGGTFNTMVMQFTSSISNVLAPRITGMVVRDATPEQLTELFIRIGRVQFLVVALIVSGFASFGQAFIELWAGPDYRDSYWIAVLTLFPLCIPLIQNTGYQILMSMNKHRFRAVLYVVIAVLNVISTWFLVPWMGSIGAALCSCVSYLAGHGIALNLYYHKVIRLDIPEFWKQILGMFVPAGAMMALTLLLQKMVRFDNWLIFFAGVIVYSVLYCVLMYGFCMNEYEKSIVHGFAGKILRKIGRK